MKAMWILLMMVLVTSAWADAQRFSAQLDAGHDILVQRVLVPAAEQPQGEVQVVRRGELMVVQTLLASRTLKRVAAAITSKEEKNWPPGSVGHVGSLRYRDELYQAVGQAWQAFRQRVDKREKRQLLAIEFILGPRHNLVALSIPRYSGKLGEMKVIGKDVLKVWRAPRDYVVLNSVEIVADSFGISTLEARAWLELQED